MANHNLKIAGKTVRRTKTEAKAAKAASGRFQRVPDSVPSQLEALQVGDSYSRGARIPISEFLQDEVTQWLDKTTRTVSMQVARTKERNPKREYTIERLQGMAHSSPNMLCAIIVTRTA